MLRNVRIRCILIGHEWHIRLIEDAGADVRRVTYYCSVCPQTLRRLETPEETRRFLNLKPSYGAEFVSHDV